MTLENADDLITANVACNSIGICIFTIQYTRRSVLDMIKHDCSSVLNSTSNTPHCNAK